MSMYRFVSCVVGQGCLLSLVHSLGKTLLAFALLHFVLKGQICLLPQVSFDFLFWHSSPLWWKGHLFEVLLLEGLVIFMEPFNFSFFSITCWGIDFHYSDIEWFALETNKDHSVVFEIASKYCILDSFIDQSWVFFGRTDAEAETPVLWPPHAKSWLIGKDSDAGRD